MEAVTLVNRTSKPLNGTWDGRQFKVKPGPNPFPTLIAEAIKKQNPIMGSQGNDIWDIQYLCGIQEYGDDVSPIEQSKAIELMDSRLHTTPVEVRAGNTSMYRGAVAVELPEGSAFEKP